MLKKLTIVILICILATNLIGQQLNFEQITSQNGLSGNNINCICRDSKGFMWFGSMNGLNRYDGNKVKVYNPVAANSKGFLVSEITSITEDKNNCLWLTFAEGGVVLFNLTNEAFTNVFDTNQFNYSNNEPQVLSVYPVNNNTVWIGTNNGLFEYSHSKGQLVDWQKNGGNLSITSNTINDIFCDNEGSMWLASLNGLLLKRKGDKSFKPFYNTSESTTCLSQNFVYSVKQDKQGYIWVGTQWGVNRSRETAKQIAETANVTFYRFFNGNQNGLQAIKAILPDNVGNTWVSTRGGLAKFSPNINDKPQLCFNELQYRTSQGNTTISALSLDKKGNLWVAGFDMITSIYCIYAGSHTINPIKVPSLNNVEYNILSMYADTFGMLWLGLRKNGILKADLNQKPFKKVITEKNKAEFKSVNILSVYASSKQQTWVGTDKGLYKVNSNTGDIKAFVRNSTFNNGIPADMVGVIYPASNQQLWLGYYDLKISLFNTLTEKFTNYSNFPAWSLRSMANDKMGNLWFGACTNTLTKFNKNLGTYSTLQIKSSIPVNRSENFCFAIAPDADSSFWLATWASGLVHFYPNTGKYTCYMNILGNENSLSCSDCRCVYSDTVGNVWVGTYGGGLNCLNKKTGKVTRYSTSIIPSKFIVSILPDKHGNLWLGTNLGLTRFNYKTLKSDTYTVSDGLPSNEFNEGASYAAPWGEFFLGSINGLVSFYPDSIINNNINAIPCIAGLKVAGREVAIGDTIQNRVLLKRGLPYTSKLYIDYKSNDIAFELASLHYAAPHKNRYRYKLEGYDKTWQQTSSSFPYANYTNLPFGTYTFSLNVTNNDGVWSNKQATIKLYVLPPWWRSWWFKLIITIVIVGSGFAFYIQRVLRLERQNKLLEERVDRRTKSLIDATEKLEIQKNEIILQKEKLLWAEEQKLRFFTSVSHELKTPLTLLVGIADKYALSSAEKNVSKADIEMMRRNAQQLLELINQLLDIGRIDRNSFQLRVQKGNIKIFVANVCNAFAQLAELNHLSFKFNCNDFCTDCEQWFDPFVLEKVLANLISNAFKFTPNGGKIEVEIQAPPLPSPKGREPEGSLQTSSNEINLTPEQPEIGEKANIVSEDNYLPFGEGRGGVSSSPSLGGGWGEVCISVSDTGRGILPEKLDLIFDRFYQDDNNAFRRYESTGIGLSLARELVELHHGKINVLSEVGMGSTFSVSIPINEEAYCEAEKIEIENSNFKNSSNLKNITGSTQVIEVLNNELIVENIDGDKPIVLIAEDNTDLRTFLKDILMPYYNVLLGENGSLAFNLALKNIPDIIITDIMMPVMNGIELTQKLKKNIETCHIPIIQLTARTTTEHQIEGLTAGADDYIAKPFNAPALLIKIQNILETRRKLQLKFGSFYQTQQPLSEAKTTDEIFIQQLLEIINNNISENELDGDFLAQKLTMSKATLYRKLQALTGNSVNIFIRNIRLKKAAEMLKTKQYNISEVVFAVGFNNHNYFSKCFAQLFGQTPSNYMDA